MGRKPTFKIIPLLIGILLLMQGFITLGGSSQAETEQQRICLHFSNPTITYQQGVNTIQVDGAPAVLFHPGKPLLPQRTVTLEFPFPTQIIDVSYKITEIHQTTISHNIDAAPFPNAQVTTSKQCAETYDSEIYDSEEYYPTSWISYYTGGGRNDQQQHHTFLTIQAYPVRYAPCCDNLAYIDDITLTVSYKEPKNPPFPTTSSYDLLIIAPELFTDELAPFVAHKNTIGVRTTMHTLEDIYREYPGVDPPEQIKYYIKEALDTWYINYVLLVGGMKSNMYGTPRDDINQGTHDWYFPVRYSNLVDGESLYDPGFISDLYYADIYDAGGNFSSWDNNNDGVFGSWFPPRLLADDNNNSGFEKDIIDLYTDLSVGRLACRNEQELTCVLQKIIAYESNPLDESWYNRMVTVAGDPWNDEGTNYLEGELIGDKALSYMTNAAPIRLYASNRLTKPRFTPRTINIVRELSKGCGHILFDGHATPAKWNTFWPGSFNQLIPFGGLRIWHFPRLYNRRKLPICVIGGCHSSLFNITLLSSLSDPFNKKHTWSWGRPIPECWSWALTSTKDGGAIATLGNTGLGYEAEGENGDLDGDGLNEPDCVEKLGGYQEVQFYRTIRDGARHLGDAWAGAINKYLNVYPGMDDQWDAKVVEQWVLLGDPSLRIGGYT